MESRISKQTIYRLILEGLVILMLFGLVGCGNSNKSVEEMAESYLRNTYNKEFVVEDLTKKDAGPFKTKSYSGFAYEKSNPENRFKVWVDKDNAQVSDAYYGVTVLSKMKEWIQSEATTIWKEVNVGVLLDVLRPTSDATYKENEYIDFLENESVECEIYLFVKSRDDLTIDKYNQFDEAIRSVLNGYVQIFIVNDCDLSSIDVVDYIGKTPDSSIRIGAPTSVIEEKLQ